MKRVLLGTTAAALCAVAGLLPAAAGPTAFGTLYEVSSAAADNAVPSSIPTGTVPEATFTAPTNPLSFNPADTSPPYTLGSWLASGGATGITYLNGASASDSMDNTIFDFVGTVSVTTGEKFAAKHDDGLTLIIGGLTVISAPGSTAAVTTTSTYTGASGNEPFQLVYAECCGPPASLVVNLPLVASAPEPATLVLIGTGIAGLGYIRRKRHR